MEMAGNRRSSKRTRTRNTVDVVDIDVDESSNNGGGGGVIEKRCLSDIPSDLWEPIMSTLFFADQINFRAVCKLWRSFDNVPPPLKQMPWLMVFEFKNRLKSYSSGIREYKNIVWDSYKLVDPTYNKTYRIDMSSINKKKNLEDCRVKIHESKYGWLLMSCKSKQNPINSSSFHSLFFYTPFFMDNNIIELPGLSVHNYYIATFDLISNLNKKTKKEESVGFEVLVLSSDMFGKMCIQTCRQGDNSWSCCKRTNWNYFHLSNIKCWVYSKGIFYCAAHLGKESESGSYDIARNSWTKFSTLEQVRPIMKLHMTLSDGKIHLISVTTQPTYDFIMDIWIYRLDLSKGIWEPIEKLGDRSLFLGNGYSSILELDDDIEELKDQRQKVYCAYGYILKHCNAIGRNISYYRSKDYGSFGGLYVGRKLWIDPPRRIRNS